MHITLIFVSLVNMFPGVNPFWSFDLAYSPLARRTCMASRDRGAETCPSRGAPSTDTSENTQDASDASDSRHLRHLWGARNTGQASRSAKLKPVTAVICKLDVSKPSKTEDLQNKTSDSGQQVGRPHVLFPTWALWSTNLTLRWNQVNTAEISWNAGT